MPRRFAVESVGIAVRLAVCHHMQHHRRRRCHHNNNNNSQANYSNRSNDNDDVNFGTSYYDNNTSYDYDDQSYDQEFRSDGLQPSALLASPRLQ